MGYVEERLKQYTDFVGDESIERQGNNVPAFMLQTQKMPFGLFFGVKRGQDSNGESALRYVGKPTDRDGHVLVVGGAGSGKSSCIVIPTLSTWKGNIFAIDIKGELMANWVTHRHKRPTKVFGFEKEKGINSGYDPFYLLREGDPDDLVQNAREISQAIIPVPPNVPEPFWTQAAQHVLTAALLYGCSKTSVDPDTGEVFSTTFNQTLTRIQTVPLWKLIKEIEASGNQAAIMHINQFRGIENPEENKMLSGISAELSNKIMVFATDARIKSAFTVSDDMMKWEDLESHNIFMRIPEDKLGQWDGAITLMLTQLIRTLERRPDMYSDKAKEMNLPPVLLLLDEFPRLGKVDVIQNAVSTLRSKGVTICIIMQSLAQLDKTYGKESRQIIVDNCQYKAILNVTDPENQKIFSDMVGTIKIPARSVGDGSGKNVSHSSGKSQTIGEPGSYSPGESRGGSENLSINISASREPIIFPHEFATLKDIALVTPEGFCRVDKMPYYPKK